MNAIERLAALVLAYREAAAQAAGPTRSAMLTHEAINTVAESAERSLREARDTPNDDHRAELIDMALGDLDMLVLALHESLGPVADVPVNHAEEDTTDGA